MVGKIAYFYQLVFGTNSLMHAEQLRVSRARPESQLLFIWMWEEGENARLLGLCPVVPEDQSLSSEIQI